MNLIIYCKYLESVNNLTLFSFTETEITKTEDVVLRVVIYFFIHFLH